MSDSNKNLQFTPRSRKTDRWGTGTIHTDKHRFLRSAFEDGLHTIQVEDQLVDILIRSRDSDTTVVFFHAAVGINAYYPSFSGDKSTKNTGLNLISIADPTLQMSKEIRMGWHIGNRSVGDFPTFMKPIIDHIADQLGTKRLILVGASAGGYAAVNFGIHFPGCIALALNPRLRLNAAPWPDITNMVKAAYGVSGIGKIKEARDRHITMDLATLFVTDLPFSLALYQNTDDTGYFKRQFTPFVSTLKTKTNLWTRLESDGRGHVPIPEDRFQDILRNLSDSQISSNESLNSAGFIQNVEGFQEG
ncbi:MULTISPECIES: alpha/beta hydrolase [Corynebacterium]|nr:MULTISPECIES: alpha/beta hydrolase [Corynebacterium]QJS14799.1 hypothetical protein HK412_00035 [Corynebacterium glutamicum]QXU46125.1 lysophospholipase [[Brevibacterium] flavum]